MWNLAPPPGFQGLHPDKLLCTYQRHLPHWRQEGATYFVTFRLGDSLPQSKFVRPLVDQLQPLENIIGSWKQFSSNKINAALGTKGQLWQEETFDRIIRDEEHLWRAIQYIGRNPDNASVSRQSCPLWIRPEWEALGWSFVE
jgi:hypothetical protein